MDAAYVFGHLGNLSEAVGGGWSVEDAFAWAVDDGPTELTLPLPGDDQPYLLRLDLHPALFPPTVASQRLTIMVGATQIAHFAMTGRQTISVSLPLELTRLRQHLALRFLHPDAVRPSDHGRGEDTRLLGFCFHSASLSVAAIATARPAAGGEDAPTGRSSLGKPEPVHGFIIGDATALQIHNVIARLPCLKGRIELQFVDASQPLPNAVADLPAATLRTVQLCWTEVSPASGPTGQAIRQLLPSGCIERTFYAPICQSLWPFLGRDSRAVPEPGLYPASRYPYGDRLAQTLAGVGMADDMLYLMYEAATNREPVDLDALFAADLDLWRRQDEQADITLAPFIAARFRIDRMFISPDRVGPALLRHMVWQILHDPRLRDVAAPEDVAAELDALLEGHTGRHEQLPVDPRVARHFALSWWSPDMKYRWMNNLLSHRDHVLNTINWMPWRP